MEDEINLMDYIRVIVKRKNLIIAFVVIGLFVGLIQGWRTPKMYKAEVTLLSMSSGMGGLASALSGLSFVGGGGDDKNITTILQSRALAKSIAEDNRHIKKLFFSKKWDNQNNQWIGEEPALNEFASALQSGFIEMKDDKLSAQWSDPQVAALIANAYARGLTKFLNQKAMSVNLQILDEAVAPPVPYNKNVREKMMFGGGGGLFVGILLIFFIENLNKKSEKI